MARAPGEHHSTLVLLLHCPVCSLSVQVRREKAIYHTLNKLSMDTSRKVLLAEAWCPLAAKPYVHEALRRAAQDSSTQVGQTPLPAVPATAHQEAHSEATQPQGGQSLTGL